MQTLSPQRITRVFTTLALMALALGASTHVASASTPIPG